VTREFNAGKSPWTVEIDQVTLLDMDWLYILFGLGVIYIHIVGVHASGTNQVSKGSPYWQGILMGLFIPYYSFYCWYKYRSTN